MLCKATGLKRPYLRELWTALRRPVEDADFARVSEVYETIAVAKAQTVLRYWNWSLSSAFSPKSMAVDDDDSRCGGFRLRAMSMPRAVPTGGKARSADGA